uniref:Palmitoyltransferase n=1 Tax=Plectus sambesii TaxID=2011161 RepID=A0A914V313_9BILA
MGSVMRTSRRNGWSWPFHPLQCICWLVMIYLSAASFAFLVEVFQAPVIRTIIYTGLSVIVAFVVGATVVVTTIDPADESVRDILRGRQQPDFSRQKHPHVIGNDYFCNICEHVVDPSSKHCRQCNKCVIDFDHHCKWLNNCVGRVNYKYFLIYVVTVSVSSAIITLLCIFVIVAHFVNPELIRIDDKGNVRIIGGSMNDSLWLLFCFATAFVALVTCVLTVHLLAFHLKLINQGLTTYNYIMGERAKQNAVETGTNSRRIMTIEWLKSKIFKPRRDSTKTIKIDTNSGLPYGSTGVRLEQKQRRSSAGLPAPKFVNHRSLVTTVKVPFDHPKTPVSIQSEEDTSVSALTANTSRPNSKGGDLQQYDIDRYTPRADLRQLGADELHRRVSEQYGDVSANNLQVVSLPPIQSEPKKIYEPTVESVFGESRELYLPAIMVKSPSIHSSANSVIGHNYGAG